MTPSTLAKNVAHRSAKSSQAIASELAPTYAMPSTERRTNENLVQAMRAANREFYSRLRWALSMNRTHDMIVTNLSENATSTAPLFAVRSSTVRPLASSLIVYSTTREEHTA